MSHYGLEWNSKDTQPEQTESSTKIFHNEKDITQARAKRQLNGTETEPSDDFLSLLDSIIIFMVTFFVFFILLFSIGGVFKS